MIGNRYQFRLISTGFRFICGHYCNSSLPLNIMSISRGPSFHTRRCKPVAQLNGLCVPLTRRLWVRVPLQCRIITLLAGYHIACSSPAVAILLIGLHRFFYKKLSSEMSTQFLSVSRTRFLRGFLSERDLRQICTET